MGLGNVSGGFRREHLSFRRLSFQDRAKQVFGEYIYSPMQAERIFLGLGLKVTADQVQDYAFSLGLAVPSEDLGEKYNGGRLGNSFWVRQSDLVKIAKGLGLKTTKKGVIGQARVLKYHY